MRHYPEDRFQLHMTNTVDGSKLLLSTNYKEKALMTGNMFANIRQEWSGFAIDMLDEEVIQRWSKQ